MCRFSKPGRTFGRAANVIREPVPAERQNRRIGNRFATVDLLLELTHLAGDQIGLVGVALALPTGFFLGLSLGTLF
jgi:hypothetical protein